MNNPVERKMIIAGGPNGSGKTTFAKKYVEIYNLDFINADEIAKDLNPEDVSAVQLSAGKAFFDKVDKSISEGKSFVLESTLSGKYLVNVIKKAKAENYKVTILFVFLPDPNINITRIKRRVEKGGHHIPDEDLKGV